MTRHVSALFAAIALMSAASIVAHAYGAQASRPNVRVEDEYVRYELLDPSTSRYRITTDVSLVTPGATSYLEMVSAATPATDVSVIDLMTGAPLPFRQSAARIDITLARPVPKGGQARIRILKTLSDARNYRQLSPDSAALAAPIAFDRPSRARRGAVVLPKDCELIHSNMPVQVMQESDGRIAASFITLAPTDTFLSIRARALKHPSVAPRRIGRSSTS